jgi:branched-chain amino acid transport system ATP-binding protein
VGQREDLTSVKGAPRRLLDEPLEGLAPIVVEELMRAMRRIISEEDMSVILVEQNAQKVLSVTDRALILERGNIVYEGVSAALQSDRRVLETHLGVAQAGKRGFDMTKATHA